MRYLAPVMGAFALYAWISLNLLGRTHLKITENSLEYRHLFGVRSVEWKDVIDIQTFSINGNHMIGLATRQGLSKKGFWKSLNASLGTDFTLSFPLSQLHSIDPGELMRILKDMQARNRASIPAEAPDPASPMEPGEETDSLTDEAQTSQGNPVLAFLASGAIAVGTAALYALGFHFGKLNLVILPLIGSVGAVHFFFRFLKPVQFRLWHRLYQAILGIGMIWVARVFLVFLAGNRMPQVLDFLQVFLSYPSHLVSHFGQEFPFLLIAVVTAGLGFSVSGPSLGIARRFSAPLLKREGPFRYKKDGTTWIVYIASPGLVEEDGSQPALRITRGCRIEVEGANLKYFQIPASIFHETGITYPTDLLPKSDDGKFVDLPFGGPGVTRDYSFDCALTVDANRQLLAVHLEIHPSGNQE